MALVFTAVAAGAGACGTSSPATSATRDQTAAHTSRSTNAVFLHLPRLTGMLAVSSVSNRSGVTTQTFVVPSETPRRAIQTYEPMLERERWNLVVPVQSVGTSAYQGAWQRDRYHLLVTTARGPEADESGDAFGAQLSLELFAPGTPLTTLARR